MAKNNKICPICDKGYSHCNYCERIGSWKALVCSHECFQIYIILSEIREGTLTEKEVSEQLNRLEITEEYANAHFRPSVAKKVIEIITNNAEIKDELVEVKSDYNLTQNFKKKK